MTAVSKRGSLDWGWKTELLVCVVGERSTLGALALLAILIVRDFVRVSRNRSIRARRVA